MAVNFGTSGNDTLLGTTGNDILVGLDGNDSLTGDAGVDVLIGDAGADTLDGGTGNDFLIGGAGNDVYIIDSTSDLIAEDATGGTADRVESTVSYTLVANVENLTLLGTGSLSATGNDLNNTLVGNSGNNILNGLAGDDTMQGGAGNDTYVVDSPLDIVTELANGGTDLIQSSITFTTSAEVENLTLIGTANINATGNGLANRLVGNSGNNVLTGLGAIDTLEGGAGDDTYVVAQSDDVITEATNAGTDTVEAGADFTLPTNVENLVLTGTGNFSGTGNTGANSIRGNSGNNTINGSSGADTMTGLAGNDSYTVDNIADVVTEAAGEGTDLVTSSVTFTLAANLENLTLSGSAAITGTGNGEDNNLIGNTGNNTLIGAGGNDTLDGGTGVDNAQGGLGNDSYIVNVSTDVVVENPGEGTDSVTSSVSFTLSANVENLTLSGANNIAGTGNADNNTIIGNTGANTLNGGAGVDTLRGLAQNDIYVVDNVLDVVDETTSGSGGRDLVQSSVDFILPTNVEDLTLTGTANINGTGNTQNNVILGNAGNNVLDGVTGNDSFTGGAGDDTYIVNTSTDVVTEATNGGIDLVSSTAVNFTLPSNVENLTLTGGSNINGTGNTQDNTILGNGGNNSLNGSSGNDVLSSGAGTDTLNGGTGVDTMTGSTGNDSYVVDNVGDIIVELSGEGTDFVTSSVTFTLPDNVEDLTLTGTAPNGIGNSLANDIIGNGSANTLRGESQNDLLSGEGGNDNLLGGTGADTLVGGAGSDSLTPNDAGDTSIDIIRYATGAPFSTADIGIDSFIGFISTGTGQDQIELSKTTFTALTSATGTGFSVGSEFAIVTSLTDAQNSSAFIVFDSVTTALYYNQNGALAGFGTSGASGQFATINTSIVAADFNIVA